MLTDAEARRGCEGLLDLVVVDEVDEPREGLRRGKGPHGAVPLALAHAMCAEQWVPALCRGEPVGG